MTVTYHAETENSAINVVDFGPFLNGSDKHGVAEALVKSFRSTGFVYLMNHPMPQEKINAMFELVRFPRQHHSVFFCSHVIGKAILRSARGDQVTSSPSKVGDSSQRYRHPITGYNRPYISLSSRILPYRNGEGVSTYLRQNST